MVYIARPSGGIEDAASTVIATERTLKRAWLLSPRRLWMTLFPTERCNFRCTYCYEDFAHGRMSDTVVASILRLLDQRASELDSLTISWFGGEPLLASDIIVKVGRHVSKLAAENGFRYEAGATTNAWFLDLEMAEQLAEVGVRNYQITLDGPPEFHDRTRVQASGRGSFERIWNNLQGLQASNLSVNVMIRCHVTGANARAWPNFAGKIRELCQDERFRVHVHKVGQWGGPNDESFQEAQEAQVAEVRDLFRDIEEYIDEEICYAATPSSLLVRSDGTLIRCTIALDDPRNHVGRLTPDGTLELDRDLLAEWFRGWEGDEHLLACPLKGLPSGGQSSKAPTVPLPYPTLRDGRTK